MKIAQVCPYDIDHPGGVQTHILDLSNALRQAGHQVTIIAPGKSKQTNSQNIFYFGKKRRLNFNKTAFEISIALGEEYLLLKAFLEKQDFDIIHFHTIWTPLLPYQIFRLSKSANIATFHDTPPDTIGGKFTRALFRLISWFLIPKLDGVIAVSLAPTRHLVTPKSIKPNIIPPCADFSRFFKNEQYFSEFEDDKINILFLGRLEERKGAMILLQAFKKLLDDKLPTRLLIAGDGELRPIMLEYIKNKNLTNVHLLGRISEEDKVKWFSTCDIFCSPALYGESFGIVLVEAMASGKSVVAADNKGYQTVLKEKEKYSLASTNDPDQLYLKLKTLVQNAEIRASLESWGKQQAKKYDCYFLVDRFLDIYHHALESRSNRDGFGK